ncbi:hypothetical protein ACJX0J_005605, partial [Zea mays]
AYNAPALPAMLLDINFENSWSLEIETTTNCQQNFVPFSEKNVYKSATNELRCFKCVHARRCSFLASNFRVHPFMTYFVFVLVLQIPLGLLYCDICLFLASQY